eukprot:2087189-Amphidinium_carterae.1
MLKDIKEEENAALRSTEAAVDAIDASLLAVQAPGPPVNDQENPLDDPLETGTVAEPAEGLSPRDLDDVR